MSKLTHRLSTVPELGAVNLSVWNGESVVQFRQRANYAHHRTNWVQCLNRIRAFTVPDTAPNGIEFGAVKARCLN